MDKEFVATRIPGSDFTKLLEHCTDLLDKHSIYSALNSMNDLRSFMQVHVYCVWDFMSLLKYLQSCYCPAIYPWIPSTNATATRLIHELLLEEESDQWPEKNRYGSHFELYIRAMHEMEADTSNIHHFIEQISQKGFEYAISNSQVPESAQKFLKYTFSLIRSNKPHCVASALAAGREHIIPNMFLKILNNCSSSSLEAPIFYHYLTRHIELDGDHHSSLAFQLVEELCNDDRQMLQEAQSVARMSIEKRVELWNDIIQEIK